MEGDGLRVWDLVKVPFPYTDRATRQRRPALVISTGGADRDRSVLWVLMVTSAAHQRWHDDVTISDLAAAGLPAPSVVRCAKVATIDAGDALRLGALPAQDRAVVLGHLKRLVAALSQPS